MATTKTKTVQQPEPTFHSGLTELNAALQNALSRLGDTPASAAEERNERMRIEHYERRAR